jgi:hypothetical protein
LNPNYQRKSKEDKSEVSIKKKSSQLQPKKEAPSRNTPGGIRSPAGWSGSTAPLQNFKKSNTIGICTPSNAIGTNKPPNILGGIEKRNIPT